MPTSANPTCSYIGASFGATAGLLRFWQSQDFSAVKARLSAR
ncbi:GNAT family N-acetyltransferase [Pseudoalteromonas sp. Hal099]